MTLPRHPVYAPLRLQPGPSRYLALFLILAHGLALATLVITPLPLWIRTVLGLLLAASLIHGFRRHVTRRSSGSITTAVWDELGLWRLTLAFGRTLEAQLLPDSFVTLPLVVLNFRTGSRWGRRSLVLVNDAEDAERLRQLRVRLKLEYRKGSSQGNIVPTNFP